MPIPNRRAGEARDEFIGRCVSEIINEYDREQAVAICYSQLHQSFENNENKRG
jgi:hypothetical protein